MPIVSGEIEIHYQIRFYKEFPVNPLSIVKHLYIKDFLRYPQEMEHLVLIIDKAAQKSQSQMSLHLLHVLSLFIIHLE